MHLHTQAIWTNSLHEWISQGVEHQFTVKVNKYETIAQLIIPLAEYDYCYFITSRKCASTQRRTALLGLLERRASFFFGKVILTTTSYIVDTVVKNHRKVSFHNHIQTIQTFKQLLFAWKLKWEISGDIHTLWGKCNLYVRNSIWLPDSCPSFISILLLMRQWIQLRTSVMSKMPSIWYASPQITTISHSKRPAKNHANEAWLFFSSTLDMVVPFNIVSRR